MLPMGAKKGQPQAHPDGPLISVAPEERARLKGRREDLELRQEDVAERAGCSTATVSNLESGRSVQVRKKVYARIKRALRTKQSGTEAPDADATFKKLVDDLVDLDAHDTRAVAALIESLKKPR